jgi:predicted Zn-dependent peptidase
VARKRRRRLTRGAQFRLRDFHFKSGLRVIAEEDHSAPVVGIINIEHLTFRAKPSGRSTWNLFQQAGAGKLNASTDFDSTVDYQFGPRDSALDLLSLEAIRILDPLAGVDQATFGVERSSTTGLRTQRAILLCV